MVAFLNLKNFRIFVIIIIESEKGNRKEINMSRCTNCGYHWADCDENGAPISLEYCHYVGPEDWAPCAQDDYEEPEEDYYDDTEEYEAWLAAETQRELEEEFREEYGAPYDYNEV